MLNSNLEVLEAGGCEKEETGVARVSAGVGKICKNVKIGSWKMGWEWSGELQTGPK